MISKGPSLPRESGKAGYDGLKGQKPSGNWVHPGTHDGDEVSCFQRREVDVKVLLVGGSGFVGQHLIRRFISDGFAFRAAIHRNNDGFPPTVEVIRNTRLDANCDWSAALDGCDSVVHLGARVHIMDDASADALAEYRRTNVEGTLRLGRQASEAGIRRFVFLSSVKVMGESTGPGSAFTESDAPAPLSPYGISKLEAEIGLENLACGSDMDVVILRSPLIYGPGVRANFLSMMRWLYRGVPLPLSSIDNGRSLIGVGNLVDLMVRSLVHPAAANEVFLASDGEDLSTPELLRRLAHALGTKAYLLPFPPTLLASLAKLTRQQDAFSRLRDSLRIDISKTRLRLGWRPPVTVNDGLRQTAAWFLRDI
jgi:nucleoside-diphosphate-sugar epimerase